MMKKVNDKSLEGQVEMIASKKRAKEALESADNFILITKDCHYVVGRKRAQEFISKLKQAIDIVVRII